MLLSGVIAGRDGAEITITQPGTYNFFCAVHPEMQAEITVAG